MWSGYDVGAVPRRGGRVLAGKDSKRPRSVGSQMWTRLRIEFCDGFWQQVQYISVVHGHVCGC
jgi:hypothetical protein